MRPVLLLVPGTLNDARVWADVVQRLGPAVQARVADITGQESIAAMAAHAWDLVADVPPQAPLLLAGFSLGGYVAIEMLAHPRRALAGCALVSTSAQPESPQGRPARERTIAALREDFEQATAGIARWCTHEPSPQLAERLLAMMRDVGPAAAIRQTRAIMGRSDHRAALAAARLPVAVLCGSHDRVTPPQLSRELAALVPGARLHVVEGAGHMLPCEQPQAVAEALRGLIEQRHPEGDRHGQA